MSQHNTGARSKKPLCQNSDSDGSKQDKKSFASELFVKLAEIETRINDKLDTISENLEDNKKLCLENYVTMTSNLSSLESRISK